MHAFRARPTPPGGAMDSFRAYRIYEQDGEVQGRLETTELDTLSAGDVVIRAVWSDVNYKDALAGTIDRQREVGRQGQIIGQCKVLSTVECKVVVDR